MSIETLIVEFCVTDFCNLGCKYCYVKRRKKFMDIAKINEYIKTIHRQVLLSKAHGYAINYFGGEPLLAFEFIKEAYQIFKRDPLCISQMMASNGTLLNDEIYHWMKNHSMGFSWSFDGESSAQTRPLLKNLAQNKGYSTVLEMCIENKDRLLEMSGKSVHYVISPHNVKNLVNDYEYLKKFGVTNIGFAICKDNVWTADDVLEFQKQIHNARILNENDFKSGLNVQIALLIQSIIDIRLALSMGKCGETPCFAGTSGCSISPGGEVYPCQRFATVHKMNMRNYSPEDVRNVLKENCYSECADCDIRLFCKGATCLFEQIKNGFKQVKNACELNRIVLFEALEMLHNLRDCETFTNELKKIFENPFKNICHIQQLKK